MSVQEEVKRLIQEAALKHGEPLPPGASQEQIAAFETRNNLAVPPELRELLQWSIAPPIGSSGLYSIVPGLGAWSIEESYRYHPIWRARGWIPLASDGSGSDYVLDSTANSSLFRPVQTIQEPLGVAIHPVYFMDHEEDDDTPSYIVASGLWTFLRFLLHREDGLHYWPFDRERVLNDDPLLAAYQGQVPLPWEAD